MNREDPLVFIVDDDVSVREALQNLLRSVGLKAETFRTAQEFLSYPRPDAPGCLVLDLRLPGSSGLDLQKKLVETQCPIPIVFITGHGDIQTSVRAMKAGAVEFLAKPFRDQEFLDAVQQCVDQHREERARNAVTEELRTAYHSLSPREREVMGLVVRGLLNKQIAADLGTSEATIKLHRGKVMQKLRAESLADLVRMAQRLGVDRLSSG